MLSTVRTAVLYNNNNNNFIYNIIYNRRNITFLLQLVRRKRNNVMYLYPWETAQQSHLNPVYNFRRKKRCVFKDGNMHVFNKLINIPITFVLPIIVPKDLYNVCVHIVPN